MTDPREITIPDWPDSPVYVLDPSGPYVEVRGRSGDALYVPALPGAGAPAGRRCARIPYAAWLGREALRLLASGVSCSVDELPEGRLVLMRRPDG